jgi:hypothetical protein
MTRPFQFDMPLFPVHALAVPVSRWPAASRIGWHEIAEKHFYLCVVLDSPRGAAAATFRRKARRNPKLTIQIVESIFEKQDLSRRTNIFKSKARWSPEAVARGVPICHLPLKSLLGKASFEDSNNLARKVIDVLCCETASQRLIFALWDA